MVPVFLVGFEQDGEGCQGGNSTLEDDLVLHRKPPQGLSQAAVIGLLPRRQNSSPMDGEFQVHSPEYLTLPRSVNPERTEPRTTPPHHMAGSPEVNQPRMEGGNGLGFVIKFSTACHDSVLPVRLESPSNPERFISNPVGFKIDGRSGRAGWQL